MIPVLNYLGKTVRYLIRFKITRKKKQKYLNFSNRYSKLIHNIHFYSHFKYEAYLIKVPIKI